MRVSVTRELLIFLAMMATGMAEGLIFDFFRILRKNTCKSFIAVSISDVIYWIITAVIFTATLLHFTYGELRAYVFVGIALGLIFYFFLISETVIVVFMKIIVVFMKIFKLIFKILLTPLAFLYKMLIVPFIRFFKKVFLQIKSFICEKKNKLFFRIKKSRGKNDKKTKQK